MTKTQHQSRIDALRRLMWMREQLRGGGAVTIRKSAGLSQEELAQALDCTPGAVSLWESGRRVPRGDLAARYASLLEELAGPREQRP